MKFIVLGGYGIIGKAVVRDLFKYAKNAEIILAGRDLERAKEYAKSFKSNRIKAEKLNVDNIKALARLLKQGDICVNCIQYDFNLKIMRSCLKAKVHYVDLGGLFHMTKKQLRLNSEFKRINKTAIIGIGAAPGISNILALYGSSFLKKINAVEIAFADRGETNPNNKFVLPYSFKTIIDEYTLKPEVFRNGRTFSVKPHSGIKEYDFGPYFGKQKGFLTLHSEIATLPSSLKNKGIRNCEFRVTFPDSFTQIILSLIDLGFASKNSIKTNEKETSIINITSAIMNKLIADPNAIIKDSEIIRVILSNGKNNKIMVDAIAHSNNKISAGVLDTAIPCSIAAQMILKGEISRTGVNPPEIAILKGILFKELAKRNIKILKNGEVIN